ncbi:hypothetical protein BDF22DRAFT_682362 [Syncephalis plumigaleata]|nr:hypothetical protein BDF22DRAFT_682362 [Syncephalis plumigaleata]
MLHYTTVARCQYLLLVTLYIVLSSFYTLQTEAAESVCAALKVSSTLCPDITFNTTVTDAKATDKTIKDLLDKISREGAGSAGADCFLSIRRTLCLTHYRKCDPTAGDKLAPVCTSVRKHAFDVCSKGGAFADSSVIDANLDGSAFGDGKDCIAVAVGTKAEDAKPVNASSVAPVNSTAVPNPPLRTCMLSDMMATYEEHCAQRHVRMLQLQKKPQVSCNDTNSLGKTERTLLCPCNSINMRNYTSSCNLDGKQTIITYQSDVRGQHCDRRLSIPSPVNTTCTPHKSNTWEFDNNIYRDFRNIKWSMRTGCAPDYCFNDNGSDGNSRTKHSLNCTVSPDECENWRVTEAGAHIGSLNTNLTSFLEFEVSSLVRYGKVSAVIFTFNVTSDTPIDAGLRAKLDGVERMSLVSNQTTIIGYEIALIPGHKHQIRWEWLGSGDNHSNASIHEVALVNAFAEINTRPSMPQNKSSATMTMAAAQSTSITTIAVKNDTQSNDGDSVQNKTLDTNSTLANQATVVTLNSSELSANINHQQTRHQSSNVTTAQKSLDPFTVANVAIAANVTAATVETVDEVAVSRRFPGGVLVTILFIQFFLWRRKLDRYLGIAELVNRWLQKRYAVVPTSESLSPSPKRVDVDQAVEYEMNHFQVIDEEDILEFESAKDVSLNGHDSSNDRVD